MIPVVLIHKGYQDYLKYTLQQASKDNKVYLLGDTNPKIEKVEFVHINTLSDGFDNFKNNYVHLNTTPHDYELFCYQRWFILRNFMKQNNLDVVFYVDSDVLLFVNVNDEWPKYNQFEMTLLHRTAAISSFLTYNGLNNFCNLLDSIYSDKNGYAFKKIASHFKVRKECGLAGGVCDMTLLEYFHYNAESGGGPGRVGEMMIISDNSTYDHNINAKDQDFSFKNGTKEIKIINKQPYVYSEKLKKDIKFNSIHFQGGAKHLISSVYGQCN